MEKTLEYRPAFPASNYTTTGLTKKEYIAAMAMQGLLANPNGAMAQMSTKSFHPLDVAESAVAYADALIGELNKKQ